MPNGQPPVSSPSVAPTSTASTPAVLRADWGTAKPLPAATPSSSVPPVPGNPPSGVTIDWDTAKPFDADPPDTESQLIKKGLARGVNYAMGLKPSDPAHPERIGDIDAIMQLLTGLGKSVKSSYDRWAALPGQYETLITGKPSVSGAAKAAGVVSGATMVVPEMLASGIEGITNNVQDGSKKVMAGLKNGDHGLTAEGAAQLVMTLGQLVGGAEAAEETPGAVARAASRVEEGGLRTAGGLLRANAARLYRYGKDPRRAIIDEDIRPTNDLRDIQSQLQDAQDKLDSQITKIVQDPAVAANKIDVAGIITNKISDALKEVAQQKGLKNRQAVIDGLTRLYRETTSEFNAQGETTGSIGNRPLTPADALEWRRNIQRNTKYVPDPELNDYVNGTAKGIVGALGDAIDDAVQKAGKPSTRALSRRWANAIEAEDLIRERIAREGVTDTGVNNLLRKGEWGAALSLIFTDHPWLGASMALNRAMRSPAARVARAKAGAAAAEAYRASSEAQTAAGAAGTAAALTPATQNTGLPQLQEGWIRFRDSRGGVHDLPADSEKWTVVKQRDPGATILQGGENLPETQQ